MSICYIKFKKFLPIDHMAQKKGNEMTANTVNKKKKRYKFVGNKIGIN